MDDFIREELYPNWIANLILVLKPNNKWRVCIDITNINSACPKDSYPFLRIDLLIDVMAGHELLCFMDAFSRYR